MGDGNNFEFSALDPVPVCALNSEIEEGCGLLSVPANGKVVYEDVNTAYFTCNAGYVLVGPAETVSCWKL